MNRNKIKANEIVFDLIRLCFDLSSPIPDIDTPRWIHTKKEHQDWLVHSKIVGILSLTTDTRFGILEFDSNTYFIATGLDDPDHFPDGFNPVEINSAAYTAIICEFELPVRSNITTLFLEDKILSQKMGFEKYDGHAFNEIVPLFPNVFMCEVTNDYIGDRSNLQQLVISYLTSNKKFLRLPYEKRTLDLINEISVLNSSILNYDSVIQMLLSSQFKFAFLDIYRSIELLYQLVYVNEVHTKLALSVNKTQLLQVLEVELNRWRPREREALEKIFYGTAVTDRQYLIKAIQKIDATVRSHHDWIYDLRNNIVHLKAQHTSMKLNDKQWDDIIYGIANLAKYWYTKFQTFA